MSKFELKMPKMGESITEGTIINWLVKEGDSFDEEDILLEVATDKVDNEVPAPNSGVIKEIKFAANDVVEVGQVLAILEISENGVSNKKKKIQIEDEVERDSNNVNQTNKSADKPLSKTDSNKNFTVSNENQFFSPLIINIAKEQHISFEELSRIPSTGKNGRLRKSDLFEYINEGRPYKFPQPSKTDNSGFKVPDLNFDKGTGKVVKMDRMRQMIADHMVYSMHTSPHVTSYVEADLTSLVDWRNLNKANFQKKYGEKLTFTPLFIEAVAKAIKDFPNINASVDGNTIIVKEDINIGMAAALPSGNLIVPVVKNADQKDLVSLAKNVNELADKARNNNLKGDEIKGGTFTISNVGTFGSLMGTPIINQPEVAILALGIIKKRAEVLETTKGYEIAIRDMMFLSLSFDHRVVDGFLGGSFLKRIAENLENFDVNREL
ncbi:2-oxoglutarate dehydrogenase E2 component (dihydrolipoamide succinyltransferase) [Flavobacteriaceae bacterium MAR_2010_188]|nr:2-oxoglutarate dehydrogenase E2 component (dihydrolipoamide succinyltransferase) [Flavobacteriaceae bacterium MAR_2010_188]